VEASEPNTPPAAESPAPLGSLAQAARTNELKQARGILIAIVVLTMAVNGFLLFNLPNEIHQTLQQQPLDPAEVEQVRRELTVYGYLLYGLPALLGLLFVVFGVIIKRFPVFITVTSLVLYVLSMAIFGYLDPTTLARGLIIKIIFIVALARSVQAALAFRAHTAKPKVGEELLG
jgi:hypothetical protein